MTPEAVLLEVSARLAARRGEPLFIREQEVSEWPVDAVTALRSHQILQRSRPATNVVCTGCERACVMPVHVRAEGNGVSRAFVVCDRRPDINRVAVQDEALKQQRVSVDALGSWRLPDGGALPPRSERALLQNGLDCAAAATTVSRPQRDSDQFTVGHKWIAMGNRHGLSVPARP
jgi:hypothetical protein